DDNRAHTSTVSCVKTWVDESPIGQLLSDAALVVSNLSAGTHRIVAKKGTRTWERAVPVAADERTSVQIQIDLVGQAPVLKHLAEVAALADTMYVVQPDFTQFRLGALRGLEKLLPEGALA